MPWVGFEPSISASECPMTYALDRAATGTGILSSSWLVFILQIPFSLVGPNIFLKTFLSKTINLLVIVSFRVHVSHAYVTLEFCTVCNTQLCYVGKYYLN